MSSKHYIEEIMLKLESLQQEFREDVQKVDDPREQALLETSAEVLGGLHNAFNDFKNKNEAAWRTAETKVETRKPDVQGQVGPEKAAKPTHG